MRTLRETLAWAKENKIAIGHFNFSDSTQFNVITTVARELSLPVLVGVSTGEKRFIGAANAVALVDAAKRNGVEVFLNLDHAHDANACKEAIDLGFDSVMFDGSKLSIEEKLYNKQYFIYKWHYFYCYRYRNSSW